MKSNFSNITSKDLSALHEVEDFRNFIMVLLNLIEEQSQRLNLLESENRDLKDEIARLKGGNPKPKIRPQTPSSPESHLPSIKSKNHKLSTNSKEPLKDIPPLKPDKTVIIQLDKTGLPTDLVSKGYEDFHQQELILKREHVLYRRERYYSPWTKETYTAPWPKNRPTKFGPQLRTFINVMHHFGDMTQGRMEAILKSIGLSVSGGSISNILKAEQDWAVKEQQEILRAALNADPVAQMDTTGNRQKGKNKVTHLITGRFFNIFYTLSSKSRLDCLLALQGNPESGILLQWDEEVEQNLITLAVGLKTIQKIANALSDKYIYTIEELSVIMAEKCAKIFEQKSTMKKLLDAMALEHYIRQTEYPRLRILLSDDAPEYQTIALNHALCWIHDARHYRKLNPILPIYEEVLDSFMKKYWIYYQKLLDYQNKIPPQCITMEEQGQYKAGQTIEKSEKENLLAAFDQLFVANTPYEQLNKEIGRTKLNKDKLMVVLEYPNLPLHNNAAELAARRVVRKRDISLHTCSEWGTSVRDAMMSLVETAIKVRISAWEYIYDRIAQKNQMTPLAQIVSHKMMLSRVF